MSHLIHGPLLHGPWFMDDPIPEVLLPHLNRVERAFSVPSRHWLRPGRGWQALLLLLLLLLLLRSNYELS